MVSQQCSKKILPELCWNQGFIFQGLHSTFWQKKSLGNFTIRRAHLLVKTEFNFDLILLLQHKLGFPILTYFLHSFGSTLPLLNSPLQGAFICGVSFPKLQLSFFDLENKGYKVAFSNGKVLAWQKNASMDTTKVIDTREESLY